MLKQVHAPGRPLYKWTGYTHISCLFGPGNGETLCARPREPGRRGAAEQQRENSRGTRTSTKPSDPDPAPLEIPSGPWCVCVLSARLCAGLSAPHMSRTQGMRNAVRPERLWESHRDDTRGQERRRESEADVCVCLCDRESIQRTPWLRKTNTTRGREPCVGTSGHHQHATAPSDPTCPLGCRRHNSYDFTHAGFRTRKRNFIVLVARWMLPSA